MTRVFIWKNNSPQEWEEISFSAFSKARRNGCFTGRFFVETVKMFRDEDDRIGKPSAQMQKQKNEKSKLSMSRTLEPSLFLRQRP